MPNLQFLFIICIMFCQNETVKTERNLQFGLFVKLCSENGYGTVCSSGTVASFRNVDILSCETECKVRKKCKYFNFNFRMNTCFLIREQYINETVTTVPTSGFVFGDKSDWDMTLYENCNNCSNAEVCIPDRGVCSIQECPSIYGQQQSYSYAVGNEYGIWKKIVYRCEDSHVLATDSNNIAECTPGGTWTQPSFVCIDIDECLSDPCLNGGQCNNLIGQYSCTCAGGWTGINCETEINECDIDPCKNGGRCFDEINAFTCACAAGWTGTVCVTNIDECASTPCNNGGTCNDMVNMYTCSCAGGWTGTHCDTDVDECANSPCENGGTCNDQVNGYTCTCASGWTGSSCETDVNECANSPCQNGGTCYDQVNGYTCTCASGWTGSSCETDVDECANSPCQNGGTCNDQVNAYTCSCASGWTGSSCETANVQCATGWSIFGTSCYRLEAYRLIFTEAENNCEGLGGHLADVTSQAEMDFLRSLYLESHSVGDVDGVWISGNDMSTEGQWKLSDGSSMSYFNWHTGQPDVEIAEDDCIQVWPHNNFMWNDVYCSYSYWFYCEQ